MTAVRFPDPQTGRTRPVEVPDNTGWPPLDDAVAKYTELNAKLDRTFEDVEWLRQEHAAAEQADREALAAALRTGEKEPGTAAVDKAAAKLRDAERLFAALQIAVEEQTRVIVAVVDEHRDTWTAEQRKRLDAARSGYLAELDRLEASHREFFAEQGRVSFLQHFPEKVKQPTDAVFQKALGQLRNEAAPPQKVSNTIGYFREEVLA